MHNLEKSRQVRQECVDILLKVNGMESDKMFFDYEKTLELLKTIDLIITKSASYQT